MKTPRPSVWPGRGGIGWRAAGMSYADRGPADRRGPAVLPGLVFGQPTVLDNGLTVTLAPGSTMPPVLVAADDGDDLAPSVSGFEIADRVPTAISRSASAAP